ncbi:hypothetical protein BU24DRAFT_423272 [Aaosphaeria arxii CBS 175.79]|uniref:Zn(2)-C6 fungal-type domain-containing protein n=1 Tax=Aaosphaeria arxii CBS 175.79 TaxID=1450172 RepID=A0A6A5XNF9_9PLEO|nr:uncharacterized protein BU24DRAFT_423272 [Aaosphaeria arxii CBS 175.79]KAF2014280.1 hypothetical protein BU24DRAFT_423272 [Aaosphaeria arxii CBS 175.79]
MEIKTRKTHKKSRKGCLACKARHVKCDEQQPICANCVKQDTPCEYPATKGREGSKDSPLLVTSIYTPSSTEGGLFEQSPSLLSTPAHNSTALNVLHLRLLHHYTTVTARSLGADPEAREAYASVVVDTAFECPFLLHMILALSALHLSRLLECGPEAVEYALIGSRHHDIALASFQGSVCDINESNFKAVFMFAGVLFPYSCASSIDSGHDADHAFEVLMVQFSLTRRVRPMVSSFYNAIKVSWSNSDL